MSALNSQEKWDYNNKPNALIIEQGLQIGIPKVQTWLDEHVIIQFLWYQSL